MSASKSKMESTANTVPSTNRFVLKKQKKREQGEHYQADAGD